MTKGITIFKHKYYIVKIDTRKNQERGNHTYESSDFLGW